MEQIARLKELRERARQRLSEEIERGQMDEVIRLAQAAKNLEAAMTNLEVSANRLAAELDPECQETARNGVATVQSESLGGEQLSSKAWGNRTRREWVRIVNTQDKGVRLRQIKGVKYETQSAKRVGIACAREREQSPLKWFLGLPDEQFDFVVLLCQPQSGPLLDFVLPADFVTRVWPLLSRNAGQKKFHVAQSGATYHLEPSLGFGPINQYLSGISVMR